MGLLGNFRGSSLASSDSPDGFVGNNYMLPVVLFNSFYSFLYFRSHFTAEGSQLSLEDIVGLVSFSLGKGFTDTVDDFQVISNSVLGLLGNDLIGLRIILSSFGVSEDSPVNSNVGEVLRTKG